MKTPKPEILDTTLRDGSYAIDFQFTAKDTALIASALESTGIRLIEVAHGLGLGAARTGHGEQAASDEAYMKAATGVLREAKCGVFFIPGIGNEDDMRLAADCGIRFVRIGTNITELQKAEPFVVLARNLGMTTSCNLMKSYAVNPEEFAGLTKTAENFGADIVCLVDSAGGMMPEDVKNYIEAAKAESGVKLGFHGHDNLSLAVANTLAGYEAGATILDTSLQGMGRSEGNAVTEVMVAILQKRGFLLDVDLNGILDVAEAFIRPMMHQRKRTGIGITSGQARFHSSFLGKALQAAARHGIDARDLILRSGERDQVNASDDMLDSLARDIAAEKSRPPVRVDIASATAEVPGNFEENVAARARELKEMSSKLGKESVFNIVVTPYEMTHVSPFVETNYGCIMSNIMLANPDLLEGVLEQIDGLVDYVLLDPGGHKLQAKCLKTTHTLTYLDHEMWCRATVAHLANLMGMPLDGNRIAITGVPLLAASVAKSLAEAGAHVIIDKSLENEVSGFEGCMGKIEAMHFEDAVVDADAVVALSPRKPAVGAELVAKMKSGATLYDGGIGSIERDAVPEAEQRNIRVVRVDMRPSLAAAALELIGMKRVVDDHMGRDTWNGSQVVAGGLIGRNGEVVVDSISRPTKVIGVADGKGGILSADDKNEAVKRVRHEIVKRLLGPAAN